ncbi:MAG: hypothetical protein ABRQ26_04295 [Syntrophomonadaceae bacterium]
MEFQEIMKDISKLQTEVATLRSQEEMLMKMLEDICKKVDNLKMWLMGVMAAVIIALLSNLIT